MKKAIIVILIGLISSVARAYVYSYSDAIMLSDPAGDYEEVWSGPNPLANIPGSIATLNLSITFAFGSGGPSANAGTVEPGDYETSPSPPTVVVDSTTAVLGPNATPLSVGDTVGPNNIWAGGGWIGGYSEPPYKVGDPAFLNPGGAYVGIQFPDTNNQIHYGWLLMRYDQPAGSYFGTLELMEAAYETDPNVPITIAPEPATAGILGVLSIGAAIRRRRWIS